MGTQYGYYLYVDASSPRQQGDRYLVQTEAYTSSDDRCMKFWYHMFGDGIGSLNVYRKFANRILPEFLWKKSGDQDNIWRMATIRLPKETSTVKNDYNILFEGVRGTSPKGIKIKTKFSQKEINL